MNRLTPKHLLDMRNSTKLDIMQATCKPCASATAGTNKELALTCVGFGVHQFEGQLQSDLTATTANKHRHRESDYQQQLQYLVAVQLTWIPSCLEATTDRKQKINRPD